MKERNVIRYQKGYYFIFICKHLYYKNKIIFTFYAHKLANTDGNKVS